MENVLYHMTYHPEMKISFVNGNRKVGKGIWCFNTLPGDKPLKNSTRGQLTNVCGTCIGCCTGCVDECYAARDAKFHFNTCIPALGRNTLLVRHDIENAFGQIKENIINNKTKVLRWHSSGEIIDYNYLLHMVKLAVEMPEIQFYCYTKRFNLIDKYLKEFKKFPKNFVVNISVWKGNDAGYNFGKCNKFVYDDHTDPKVMKMKHCPAVDKNGKSTGVTCSDCGWCFKGNYGRITAVHQH